MKKLIRILAIETSCDETAAAVIGEAQDCHSQLDSESRRSLGKLGMTGWRPVILSNIISSQVDLHAKTGGVVPEVASRAHMEAITPVIALALLRAKQESPISNDQLPLNDHLINDQMNENCELTNENYQEAIALLKGITHIAVTSGPGLIGSLLVGFNAAKTMAYARDLPIIPINHIEGHIYSALVSGGNSKLETRNSKRTSLNSDFGFRISDFPLIALTVSGGHTSLTLMRDHGKYELIGETVDDAVGEAYDKVAKLLGLGYPGGPIISNLASKFRESRVKGIGSSGKTLNSKLCTLNISFPRPMIDSADFNFSFSGLKTAVLIWVKKYLEKNKIEVAASIPELVKEEIAAAFEEAVRDVLVAKTEKAVQKYKPKAVIFAGGVSANRYLASQIGSVVSGQGLVETTNHQPPTTNFFVPDKDLTGDNAAMIGLAAYYHIQRGDTKRWDEIEVSSNFKLK